MANLIISANISSSDTPYTASGAAWIDIDTANDYLIPSNGSDELIDAADIPTQSQINQAGVILTGSQQIVPKYFLADVGSNRLWDIDLMGNTIGRYVLAFDIDASTATEPVLQLWDDANLNTILSTSLGAGTASNSWWKGITTTSSAPGANWTGSTLAGSSDGNYLNLNDGSGALVGADTLYCNLKIVIPASATTALNNNPIFAIKFASN